MIHEFIVNTGNINVTIHVVSKTREDALYLLKERLLFKKIKLDVSEYCVIDLEIKSIEEKDESLNLTNKHNEFGGRYSSIDSEFLEEREASVSELSDDLPEEDEVTKPDNPVAIRRSTQKLKAVKA